MTRPDYVMLVGDIIGCTLADIQPLLAAHPKKVIGQVEIRELAQLADSPTGVYLFYKIDAGIEELVYVGKATSRSFIDRVPSHFDPREEAWMNSLPKHAMKSEKLKSYQEALDLVLTLRVVLIGVDGSEAGGRAEGAFRSYLAPRYNATKPRFSGREVLGDLVRA